VQVGFRHQSSSRVGPPMAPDKRRAREPQKCQR
jgi:hypothetical protein